MLFSSHKVKVYITFFSTFMQFAHKFIIGKQFIVGDFQSVSNRFIRFPRLTFRAEYAVEQLIKQTIAGRSHGIRLVWSRSIQVKVRKYSQKFTVFVNVVNNFFVIQYFEIMNSSFQILFLHSTRPNATGNIREQLLMQRNDALTVASRLAKKPVALHGE